MCCIVMFCTCVYVCSGGNVSSQGVSIYAAIVWKWIVRQVYVSILLESLGLALFYPPFSCCRYAFTIVSREVN